MDAMEPGLQCVRTHSKPGFMSSGRTRDAQVAVLAVPVFPAGRCFVSLS